MTRKYVDGTKQTSKKKKVKTATIQAETTTPTGNAQMRQLRMRPTATAKIPTVKENFDPDIFWYGGTQGVMKLTACSARHFSAAIGKAKSATSAHGFKTFCADRGD